MSQTSLAVEVPENGNRVIEELELPDSDDDDDVSILGNGNVNEKYINQLCFIFF